MILVLQVYGSLALAEPLRGCSSLTNREEVKGRIVMMERSDCMFQEKARHAAHAGARALIVFGLVVSLDFIIYL